MTVRHPLPDEPVQVVTIAATGGTLHADLLGSGDRAARVRRRRRPRCSRRSRGSGASAPATSRVAGPDGGPFELRFGGELTGKNVVGRGARRDAARGSVEVTTQVPSPWE